MDSGDLEIRLDLSGRAFEIAVYHDQPTKMEKKVTFLYYVAPFVAPEWTMGEQVPFWVACSDLSGNLEDCLDSWSLSPKAALVAAPDLTKDFRRAVENSVEKHGLVSRDDAPILYAMMPGDVSRLRTLPRQLLAVVLSGLLIWGAVTWSKSRPRERD